MSTIHLSYNGGNAEAIVNNLRQIKEQHRLAPEVFFHRPRDHYNRDGSSISLTLGGENEDTPLVKASVALFPESLLDPDPSRSHTRWQMDRDGEWYVRLPKAKAVKLLERLNAPEHLLQGVRGRVTIETFRSLSLEQTTREDGTEVETVTTEAKDTPSVQGKIETMIDGIDVKIRLTAEAPRDAFAHAVHTGYMPAKDVQFLFSVEFDEKPALDRLHAALHDAGFKTYDGYAEHHHTRGTHKQNLRMFVWREDPKLAEKIKSVTDAFGHPPFAFWQRSGSEITVDFVHPNQDRTIHACIELLPEDLVRLIEDAKDGDRVYAKYHGSELRWQGPQTGVRKLLKLIGADEGLARRFVRTETFDSTTIKQWNDENPKRMRRKGSAIKEFKGEYKGCKVEGTVGISLNDRNQIRFSMLAEYDLSSQIEPILVKLREYGFQLVEGGVSDRY